MTLAEKILARKCGKNSVAAGEIVIVPVDCAMMTDILGPRIIAKQLDDLGLPIKRPKDAVVIADHYTPAATEHQAEIVAFSRDWAKKHGTIYYELEGPCHQVLAEKGFSYPGNILVGTDSHSCMAGAFSCFGTGVGSTEMLAVLVKGEIWFKVPETIRIDWNGTFGKGVYAKDLILATIGLIGHAGATYKSMEFSGSTFEQMIMDERLCVANMAVEAGAKVGLIPADEITLQYMEDHGVENVSDAPLLRPDAGAVYEKEYTLNAAVLEPMIACPHGVDNVKPVPELSNIAVDQVYIGSCTGGRLSDLRIAAGLLQGKRVADGCRLLVSPASRLIWRQAMDEGLLSTLEMAGATILAPTCGACLGLHSGTIGKGEVCVSTTNRNFIGRMGSKHGSVYLASAATAAATAIFGKITDPRKLL